jgi:uncharacterized membrane protein YgcG
LFVHLGYEAPLRLKLAPNAGYVTCPFFFMQTIKKIIGIPFTIIGAIFRLFYLGVILTFLIGAVTVAVSQGVTIGTNGYAPGIAPNYPSQVSRYVNDYADLLNPEEETELRTSLADLENDNGALLSILTIDSSAYLVTGEAGLTDFSANLFSAWDLGSDGVLILLSVREDGHGEMRIQLGRAYGNRYDEALKRIIDNEILPLMRAGEYARGIQVSTRRTIEALTIDERGQPWLEELRAAFARGGAAVRNGLAVLFLALSTLFALRNRLVSGGLGRNLTSLSLAMIGGSLLGILVGSAIGAATVDLTSIGKTIEQVIDTVRSPRILDAVVEMNQETLVGAGSGAVGAAVLWFMRGGHSHYAGFGGDGSGTGSSGGGGAGGSW